MADTIERPSPLNRQMLIDGAWVPSAVGPVITVENPAKRVPIAEVPRGNAEDVDRAVEAAHRAFPAWSRVVPRDRGRLLLKIAEAMEARVEEIARLLALENGNALRTQARPEAKNTADIFRYFGGLAGELEGRDDSLRRACAELYAARADGVVGAIIPWNAPILLGALKIAPALCAGNTLVMKAAEDAPLAVLLMAEICQEFLPKGVLNLLDRLRAGMRRAARQSSAGAQALLHRLDRSRQVGDARRRRAHRAGVAGAGRQEPVHRLSRLRRGLGGRRHGRRHALHPAEPVLHRRLAHVPARRHFRQLPRQAQNKGRGAEDRRPAGRGNRYGLDHQQQAVHQGVRLSRGRLARKEAKLVFGGLPPKEGPLAEGYFAIPTVFADSSNDWRLAREEIFGPVLVAIPWRDEDDAIRMANDSHYGLAAYVWTHEIGRGLRAAHAIQSGWVQVNQGLGQVPGHSYGGYKQSGIGREFSLEGMLDSYTQRKNVTVNLMTPVRGS